MKRTYSTSHIAMLKATLEMQNNVITYIEDFALMNIIFTLLNINSWLGRIDKAFLFLGTDNVSETKSDRTDQLALREKLKKIFSQVLVSAAFGYKDTPSKYQLLIKPLEPWRTFKPNSDEQMTELAINIAGSIDDKRNLYTDAGIPDALVDSLKQTALDLIEAYKTENIQSGHIFSVSEENQIELNAVYAQALFVSKIARRLYPGDKNKLKLFTFSTIAGKYKRTSHRKKNTDSLNPVKNTELAIVSNKLQENNEQLIKDN
jgi:hypothetical protein